MKITKAIGNGQSQCSECKRHGKWNVQWTEFMYKIEGKDGIYCRDCVNKLKLQERVERRIL